MMKYTLEKIRKIEQDFIPCPFCKQKPTIVFSDDECNWKDQDSEEYLNDPWSGLCFMIKHNSDNCPICPPETENGSTFEICYDSPEDAVKDWNNSLMKNKNAEEKTK